MVRLLRARGQQYRLHFYAFTSIRLFYLEDLNELSSSLTMIHSYSWRQPFRPHASTTIARLTRILVRLGANREMKPETWTVIALEDGQNISCALSVH